MKISADELQKVADAAYMRGYADGMRAANRSYTPWWVPPQVEQWYSTTTNEIKVVRGKVNG